MAEEMGHFTQLYITHETINPLDRILMPCRNLASDF